jgi:hypothetical protein
MTRMRVGYCFLAVILALEIRDDMRTPPTPARLPVWVRLLVYLGVTLALLWIEWATAGYHLPL